MCKFVCLRSSGKAFQRIGASTEKVRSPYLITNRLVYGTQTEGFAWRSANSDRWCGLRVVPSSTRGAVPWNAL